MKTYEMDDDVVQSRWIPDEKEYGKFPVQKSQD